MANRPSPATAARAAVAAAANVTRGIEHALLATVNQGTRPAEDTYAITTETPKPDGRRQRWEKHKQARRTELTDGTIDAVRELGPEVGMDEIASHIGVSKTVLYRYFTDKNDLAMATMVRFFESRLFPRLTEAITDDVDEYTLTRTVVGVYVHAVADDPNLYRFTLGGSAGAGPMNADSEKLVAQLLATAITMRAAERDSDVAGVEVWSYTFVGGLRRAVDWWMTDRRLSEDEMIDYVTMLIWSAIVGIAAVNGSREAFMSAPPVLITPADLEKPDPETP